VKIRWNGDKAAVVLQAEGPNESFTLGKLYGRLRALKKDCLQGGEGTGEQISLTIPVTYMLNELVKD